MHPGDLSHFHFLDYPEIHPDARLAREQIVKATAALHLSATVSGKPTPTVSWMKDDCAVDDERLTASWNSSTGRTTLALKNAVS